MSQQIYEAIPKVMAEVGSIAKNRKNQQQGYAFRGIDDVFAAFQAPLATHGVFYVPEVLEECRDEGQTKSGGTMFYTRLRVAYTFYAQDGSNVRAVVVGEAMDSADKSSNKAMSAALKYALLQIFCVPTESEDADAQSPEIARRQTAKPANGTMSERDRLLASVKELLETVSKDEAIAQMTALNVDRVSAMSDAQLVQYRDGLQLAIKNGRTKGGA